MMFKNVNFSHRYYVFETYAYYPSGGMYDLKFTTDDEDEAHKMADKFNKKPCNAAHIFDTLEKKVIDVLYEPPRP